MKTSCSKIRLRGFGWIASLALILLSTGILPAAVIVDFESGFSVNDTTFPADGGNFTIDNNLVITQFNTFGSGGGNWFIDSGFGISRSGSVGSLDITTSAFAFYLTSVDLWTSNDAGNTNASGQVTLIGTRPNLTTVSTTILVQPTGFTGNDWDTSNNLSAFAGIPLISVEFQIGAGLNYLAIDKIGLETVAIPEPNTALLALAAASFSLVSCRRRHRA